MFQGGGLVAMNLGSLGFHPFHVAVCLLGLASAFILPQKYRMTFNVPWNQQPTFPLSFNVRWHSSDNLQHLDMNF